MTDSSLLGGSTPLVFLRPIGIAAGDAMRLMELAKRLRGPVRWRMAPPGVAADAYLVHSFSVNDKITTTQADSNAWQHAPSVASSPSSGGTGGRKISLDAQGWHRGRPVCLLGMGVDTATLDGDELAPLVYPDALQELEHGLQHVLSELVGSRMLYVVGEMAWEQRHKWPTHRLHAIQAGQLVGVIDAHNWQFYLLEGCSVDRMAQANLVPMPRSGGFAAEGFHSFMLETALWEFAKRCPEPRLEHMLPGSYLQEPLTHRRAPHLKESALGDYCVSILRSLDVRARTADELQTTLRMTRPSLLRALTCLALVRAIQPESRDQNSLKQQFDKLWSRLTGKRMRHAFLHSSKPWKRQVA